jgi:hypothetical protein
MEKMLLKLVGLFKHIFLNQEIDYERMMSIVKLKLTMDKRRVYMNWKQKQQKKESTNHLTGVLLFYGLLGIFMSAMIYGITNLVLVMIILHGYVLFTMSMTLITDFSSVLLDTTDNQVILPRPISSKTLFAARLVHILVYLLQFTIAIALLPIITCFIVHGLVVGLLLICTTLLSILFAVFVTYILYLLIIKYSNENKVRDIVTYFQIFMTVVFSVGFQVLPRVINLQQLTQNFELQWYAYLAPPVWMACTIEAIAYHQFDGVHVLMIAVSVLVPIITFWFMNKYLAPSFAQKLSLLNNGDTTVKTKKSITNTTRKSLSAILSALTCKTNTEKASLEMTWKMTSRDKGFKLQFYPSLAYVFVFIFIFVFKNGKEIRDIWSNLGQTNSYLWFFYVPLMTISGSITIIAFNENYMASWIYHSLPITKPGYLISGQAKALFIKFFLPVFTLLLIFCLGIWDAAIIDDAIFALVNNFFCFLVFANFAEYYLPFSRQPNTQQQTGKFLKTMLQLLIVSIMVLLHYVLIRAQLNWLLWLLTPVLAVVSWLLLRRLQSLQWRQIVI